MSRPALFGCMVLGLAGCCAGLMLDPKAMLASYLVAWVTASAIPIGALAVLMISYLVRAGWTQDMYEPLSRAALSIPIAAVLFVPILIGMNAIYPWASGAVALPAFKAAYLTPAFFALRAVAYFVVWSLLAFWATRAYGNPAAMQRVASVGLIVWALTVSWAGIDWLESVEPAFHSSIYGLLVLSSFLLAALAFGLIAVLTRARPRQMANAAYGGVLLSTLLLWAYLHAMQYIIIWAGNIPDEVIWYLRRLDGGWAVALYALFIIQFVLPFFALLSGRIRASTWALLAIAGVTLAARYLEAAILILPPLGLAGRSLLFCLAAALLVTGAAALLAWRAAGELRARASSRATAT